MVDSKKLEKLFLNTVVHIKSPYGTGTGFLIYPGYVLTCAHVVAPDKKSKEGITCHFKNKSYEARLVNSDNSPSVDLALLKIGYLGHECLRFAEGDSLFLGKNYYSFGFQNRNELSSEMRPDQATLEFEGSIDPERDYLIKFKKSEILSGMSGAPIIDESGNIVGITKSTRDEESDLGAEGIPLATIQKTLKKWKVIDTLQTPQHIKKVSVFYKKAFGRFDKLKLYSPKIIFLAVTLVGIITWFQYHLGLSMDTLQKAPIVICLLGIIWLLDSHPDNELAQSTKLLKGEISKKVFGRFIMGLMFAGCIGLWLFFSTISVYANDNTGDKISILSGDKIICQEIIEQRTNHLLNSFTNVENLSAVVEGYPPVPIIFQSWKKSVVYFPRDFEVPTLYIRIPHELAVTYGIMNNSKIVVRTKNVILYEIPTENDKGAVHIGNKDVDLNNNRNTLWRDELGGNVPNEEVPEYLEIWGNASTPLEELIRLPKGDSIFIEMSKNDALGILADGFVYYKGGDQFEDVLLQIKR